MKEGRGMESIFFHFASMFKADLESAYLGARFEQNYLFSPIFFLLEERNSR